MQVGVGGQLNGETRQPSLDAPLHGGDRDAEDPGVAGDGLGVGLSQKVHELGGERLSSSLLLLPPSTVGDPDLREDLGGGISRLGQTGGLGEVLATNTRLKPVQ